MSNSHSPRPDVSQPQTRGGFVHRLARRSAWRRAAGRAVAVAVILSLQATGAARAADISAQMSQMFGSGTLANTTGPGVYRSQTQNIYMGGEMQLRFPARNYQLYSLSLPSIKAGCGGVDIYMGSFSHINSQQFKSMLEAVARAYVALLFKAALKSINPLLESVLGDLQKTLETFNQYNGNTCAMAQALVDGTSQYTGMDSQKSCVSMAMQLYNEDEADAKRRCRADTTGTNADAKQSGDASIQGLAERDLNIVWEALKNTTYSSDEKHVFLNLAGTRIVYKPANNSNEPKTPKNFSPAIDSLTVLLHGHEPANSVNQVRIRNWISCDTEDCLAPTVGTVDITPFPTLVRQMLEGIRDQLANRQALTPAQLRFVNMTRVPVYRMLAVGYSHGSAVASDEMVDLLINRYSKVIAYDYAYMFLRGALKEVRTYLGMAALKGRVEEFNQKYMLDNVNGLLAEIEAEHTKAQGQVREANAMVEDLVRVEKGIRQGLPSSIRGMLDFTSLMRGNGGRG